ncbi:MAG: hypothetical protein KJ906_02845 [Nanoarchaeota archaeon]|nr:hypothetical protein [Nanoarchaeota archaeon]
MKGQIFIVVSILIAVSLLGLSIGMKPIVVEDSYIQNYFVNVRTEIRNTVDLALLDDEDVSDKLDEYIDFSELVLENKGILQDINYNIESDSVIVNIYLERGEEYYSDQIVIPLGVYT